jgi:hypothetical protein
MTIPGMNIRIPATVEDMRECYQEALAYEGSTYIRCTSRAAKLDVEPVRVNSTWRKLPGRTGTRAVVCIGESLTYALQTYTDTPIYWTMDPKAQIPDELYLFEELVVLESYTNSFIQIPKYSGTVIRRHFRIEHKKIMQKNLGWEDFQE